MKLTPFLLLAASPVLASSALDQRISKLEQQMEEVRMCSVLGSAGAKTRTATPDHRLLCTRSYRSRCFTGSHLSEAASLLSPIIRFLWQVPIIGNLVQVNSDWQFGFKAGLGYRFSNIDWALSAEFTRVKFDSVEHSAI